MFNSIIQIIIAMTLFISSGCTKQEQLVYLDTIDPTILIDLKYATKDNFVHQVIYSNNRARLLPHVANALHRVQQELKPLGLGLKIWDAYRPLSAQKLMWQILPDSRYVANPQQGGRHTRGTAVDLTIINLQTQKELQMPTNFDDFTEFAHRNYVTPDPQVNYNVKLLEQVMLKYGFVGYEMEWWHYDYQNWQECPVLIND